MSLERWFFLCIEAEVIEKLLGRPQCDQLALRDQFLGTLLLARDRIPGADDQHGRLLCHALGDDGTALGHLPPQEPLVEGGEVAGEHDGLREKGIGGVGVGIGLGDFIRCCGLRPPAGT